jgi:hypothetical protein
VLKIVGNDWYMGKDNSWHNTWQQHKPQWHEWLWKQMDVVMDCKRKFSLLPNYWITRQKK